MSESMYTILLPYVGYMDIRAVLSSQMVDLVSLYFIFILFHFLIFLFLEHRVRVRSQDTENEVEGSRTDNVIQHRHYMLVSYSIHGHLR